jgi:hypothetical protein
LPEQTRLDALAQTGGLTGFRTFDRSARDFAELFEGGFEVFDDFRGEDGRSGGLSDSSRLSSFSQKMSGPGKKTTDPLTRLRFLCRGVPVVYTVYRTVSVASCPLVVSLKTESPKRIILLITSQQTGIL